MKLRTAVSIGSLLWALSLGAASLPALASVNGADSPVAGYTFNVVQEASNLLGQVHSLSRYLKSHTATLESFYHSNLSWRSHAHALDEIRDGIGSAGGLLGRLLQIRDEVEPWQRHAIDRISPTLENLAIRTEAALLHLEANRDRPFVPDYQENVSAIAKGASEMHESLGAYLAYAAGQQRLDRLMQSFGEKS